MASSNMQAFTYPVDPEKCKLIKKKTTRIPFMGCEAVVYTYTVRPTNDKGKILRGGPDDNTLKDPELAELVRRGCSDLFIDGKLVAQVRGPRKFFGTDDNVDEDELPFEGADEKDFAVFTTVRAQEEARLAQWQTDGILVTKMWEKANGKFAICSLFILDGQICVFGGSKNMHVPLVLNADLDTLPQDLHFRIMSSVIQDLRKCDAGVLSTLLGRQIIGEFCDGMHVVYTDTPYMVYFDETLPACFRKPMMLLPAINGLPSTEVLTSLRKLAELEGVVVYYTNTKTGEIIRRKHKTIWYVLIRCWREIIHKQGKGNITPSALTNLLVMRMRSRSDQFLHLTQDEFNHWKDVAATFVQRLTASKYRYADVHPFGSVGMAKIWYELMINPTDNQEIPMEEVKESPVTAGSTETMECDFTSQLVCPTFKDILIRPEYFHCVASAANITNVLVIMQGPPGSGKSTVVKQLQEFLTFVGSDSEVFSTDDLFMVDGVYKFDPKLLGVNHGKNLTAACASSSRVVIIDNTNLTAGEYSKYKSGMLNRIIIVLSCKAESPEVLVRNSHGVPLDHLKKMCAKYSPAAPAYIGGFVRRDALSNWKDETTQIQPPHLTEQFVGGDHRKMQDFNFETLMQPYEFEITGVSRSPAGVGLVCKADIRSESTPHITLGINEGFKAMDVGKQIAQENVTVIDPPIKQCAVRLPMF